MSHQESSRYLQTLNSISAENNSTIVFPVPIDIISQLISAEKGGEEEEAGEDNTIFTVEREK